MKITIEFSTDNAAFEDNPREVEQLLLQATKDALEEEDSSESWVHLLFDSNGNSCGTVRGEVIE